MGELYVSASEIESFDLCPRKWAFTYIEKKRPPPNDSAALGTRVHAILEKWLNDGTAPDTWTPEGEIAASGLHLLPVPRTPSLVTEEQFHFTSQRAWYTGFKDFRYRDANGLIHIGDHKTTKSFTWAKSLDEILCHSQALIYAVDEFRKNPNDERLALDWIYYKTTGSRKAEPRFQIVSRQTVAEMFFEHVDPVAGEITKLHHEVPPDASALDFTPDFRACDAFGGCAFLSICNPTPTQRVQANMTQAGMSLAEKLKNMKADRAPSPVHPPEAFTAPVAPAVPFVHLPVASGMTLPMGQAAQVVPSAAPTFSLPFPEAQAAPVAPPAAPVPLVAQAAPVAPPVVVPPEPKKRGRPKASTAAASTAAPVASAPLPLQEAIVEAAEAAAPVVGFTLYIGCAPVGCEVTNALEYVNVAYAEVKHRGSVLCDQLEKILLQLPPTGDVLFGSTQIEEDTASLWLSKATKVVRAFR